MCFLLRFRSSLVPMVLGSLGSLGSFGSLAACGGKTTDTPSDDSGVDVAGTHAPPIDARVDTAVDTSLDTAVETTIDSTPDVIAEAPPPSPSSSVDLPLVVDDSSALTVEERTFSKFAMLEARCPSRWRGRSSRRRFGSSGRWAPAAWARFGSPIT